ncbi:hypothetical protein D3C85_815770 [compost metagenome]
MAVGIALGGDDGHATFLVDAEEAVRAGNRLQCVDRYGQAAVGTVFEANCRGQARSHFSVRLRFCGACAYGRPADQILQILWRDRVEGFGSGWQAHFRQVTQQLATDVQAVLDLERVVQVRVVDQALPAHGGTWLFEVHAHHQIQAVRHFCCERLEVFGVIVGGFDVVNRAGADHHEQAMVFAIEDVANHLTASGDSVQRGIGQRNFAFELIGRDQGFVGGNVKVVDR